MIPQQRQENMVASIQKYLDTNWPMTMIHWEDSSTRPAAGHDEKDVDAVDEWIEPVVMVGARRFRRQTGQGRVGAQVSMLLNVNIFQRRKAMESIDSLRLRELRDNLVDLFGERIGIPFLDYVGNPTTPDNLGVMCCFDIKERPLPMDTQKGLYQYNVTAEIFALEERADPIA